MSSPDDVPTLLVVILFGSYFLPTILVYFIQRSCGHSAGWRARMVLLALLTNLLAGWTIIGWFWALKFARVSPEDWVAARSRPAPAGRPAGNPWDAPKPAAEPSPCSTCGGSGYTPCPSCGGRRGEWLLPQTEHGVAQWRPCTYCGSSGQVTCGSCGGHRYSAGW
jgi:hypothetical protein